MAENATNTNSETGRSVTEITVGFVAKVIIDYGLSWTVTKAGFPNRMWDGLNIGSGIEHTASSTSGSVVEVAMRVSAEFASLAVGTAVAKEIKVPPYSAIAGTAASNITSNILNQGITGAIHMINNAITTGPEMMGQFENGIKQLYTADHLD